MKCIHADTVWDTGRTFCAVCGVQTEQRPAQIEETNSSCNIASDHIVKEKYFQRALTIILGEEEVSASEQEALSRLALKALQELGEAPAKLSIKRFVSKQERSDAAVCRRHFPLFMSLNGHPLPVVTSLQRRYMRASYERAVLAHLANRNPGKKNVSCRDVIRNCLAEFAAQARLPLSPPRRAELGLASSAFVR